MLSYLDNLECLVKRLVVARFPVCFAKFAKFAKNTTQPYVAKDEHYGHEVKQNSYRIHRVFYFFHYRSHHDSLPSCFQPLEESA
jgi:hypothetical protein